MYPLYTNLLLLKSCTGKTPWKQMRTARRINGVRRYARIWTYMYIHCRLIQVILPILSTFIYLPQGRKLICFGHPSWYRHQAVLRSRPSPITRTWALTRPPTVKAWHIGRCLGVVNVLKFSSTGRYSRK